MNKKKLPNSFHLAILYISVFRLYLPHSHAYTRTGRMILIVASRFNSNCFFVFFVPRLKSLDLVCMKALDKKVCGKYVCDYKIMIKIKLCFLD